MAVAVVYSGTPQVTEASQEASTFVAVPPKKNASTASFDTSTNMVVVVVGTTTGVSKVTLCT